MKGLAADGREVDLPNVRVKTYRDVVIVCAACAALARFLAFAPLWGIQPDAERRLRLGDLVWDPARVAELNGIRKE